MARFEQRVTDEQVGAARRRISDGVSLRAAAAEVPCAASTLSARIKKAEMAEANALLRSGIGKSGGRRARGAGGRLEKAAADEPPGPLEVLSGALLASRANGEPDWPTRVTAARALATLRPELVESPADREQAPSITVYDLAPGSPSVLHRPLADSEPPQPDDSAAPPEPLLKSGIYLLVAEDRVIPIAEVDVVAGETTTAHLLNSREGALEVLRTLGGDSASLELVLAADQERDQESR